MKSKSGIFNGVKIIDSKGRLFGIINIIDLGVIVILITSGYIFFNLARNAKLGYPIEVEAKVLFSSLPLDIVEKLQPGDMEDRRYGRSKLIRFEIKEKDNRSADIHAWLKLSLRVKDVLVGTRGHKAASFFLKGQELNIDDPIVFTTSKYSMRGIVLNISGMDRDVEVILDRDIPDEVTDAVKAGDKVTRWQHLVGEVISKEYTHDGKIKVRLHIKRGEVSPKLGEYFSFETERYYVYGTVVKSTPWKKD